MLKRLLMAGAAALALSTTNASAADFSSVYSFGDSLSDNGNLFIATGGATPPSPPYFNGRVSNGIVWTEYLTGLVNASEQSGLLGPAPQTNFAFAGAESTAALDIDFLTQINGFAASGAGVPGDALATVWIGNNDYLRNATTTDPSILVPQTVGNVATGVATLNALGARTILVNNLPDFGASPGGAATGLGDSLRQLAAGHNTLLQTTLNELDRTLDAQIVIADIFALFDDVLADPSRYGFSNVTIPCLLPDASPTGACPNAAAEGATLFWDAIHPTTAGHNAVARFANATLVQALDAPAELATSAYLGPVIADGVRASTASRMRALRAANLREASTLDTGAYGGGLYVTGDRDASDSLAGFNYDFVGGIVGADTRIGDNIIAGAAISYGSGDATSALVTTDVDAVTAALYASATFGGAFLDVTGIASWEDMDITRQTLFAERPTTSGETDGQTWLFALEGGYHMEVGPKVKIGPVVGVNLVATQVDDYTETGSVLFDSRISDRNLSGWNATFGVEALGTFVTDTVAFSPYARIQYETSVDDYEAITRLRTGLNQVFSADGVQAANGQWGLNAGTMVMMGPHLGFSVDYEGTLDTSNGEEHVLSGRAIYQF